MSVSGAFKWIGRSAGGFSAKLKQRGWLYWITVVILIAAGIKLGSWLEVQDFALNLRYRIYQSIQARGPREPFIQRTVVILVGDEEYWKGDLARRVPIKRDYLAKLITALDQANPAVIALDFDLRAQTPDGTVIESKDYTNETNQLFEAVKSISKSRTFVLPKTINLVGEDYVSEWDIHDAKNWDGGNLTHGYIALPADIRKLPLAKNLNDGTVMDSFATAIVRAVNEAALQPVKDDKELPFLRYLPADAFETISPSAIFERDAKTLKKIQHNIVIIGAGWHTRAYGRGALADTYLTPVGPIQGALLHANYVEALLDNRTSNLTPTKC